MHPLVLPNRAQLPPANTVTNRTTTTTTLTSSTSENTLPRRGTNHPTDMA